MSLTVKHLNADSTFLLTFQPLPPSISSPFPPSPGHAPASFSIVVDPWLTGPSTVYHPKFATSRHRHLPCIASLRDLPEPDLIIISQAKPDHCHEETLRRLPGDKDSKTLILAHPGAAKLIKSWNHFPPEKVQTLERYDPRRDHETIWRFKILPPTPTGKPGEVTVALMQNKLDITGVHSAIGITYRPPTPSSLVPTPISNDIFPPTPPDSPFIFTDTDTDISTYTSHLPPSPPPPLNRPISVLYSPHGVPYRVIQPYAAHHLLPLGGIPLTLLLHSFDRVKQPWYLGGKISLGLPGGMKIANALMAKCWISAHDEDKFVGGITTEVMKTRKYDLLDADDLRRGSRHWTEMCVLDSGMEMRVDAGPSR